MGSSPKAEAGRKPRHSNKKIYFSVFPLILCSVLHDLWRFWPAKSHTALLNFFCSRKESSDWESDPEILPWERLPSSRGRQCSSIGWWDLINPPLMRKWSSWDERLSPPWDKVWTNKPSSAHMEIPPGIGTNLTLVFWSKRCQNTHNKKKYIKNPCRVQSLKQKVNNATTCLLTAGTIGYSVAKKLLNLLQISLIGRIQVFYPLAVDRKYLGMSSWCWRNPSRV